MTKDPDPRTILAGSEQILDDKGRWQNFHDAEVTEFAIIRGDVRPEAGVYIGPRMVIHLKLCALKDPFTVCFTFEDCESIRMVGFNNQNPIMDLTFDVEARGRLLDGTPMTPYLVVHFLPVLPSGEFELSFKCFRASVERLVHHD